MPDKSPRFPEKPFFNVHKKGDMYKLYAVLLVVAGIFIFPHQDYAQTQVGTTDNVSGGRRSLFTDNPASSLIPSTTLLRCPNTLEFVPADFDPNDPNVKYPLLISFPTANMMIDPNAPDFGSATNALLRAAAPGNIFVNEGVNRLIANGTFPTSFTVSGNTFKFIYVFIQCRRDLTFIFNDEHSNIINNYILQKYATKVDMSRIYMIGGSRGGGTVWEYFDNASRQPRIAAILPFSGGTEYGTNAFYNTPFNNMLTNLRNYANSYMGIWASHNTLDFIVPFSVTNNIISGINTPTVLPNVSLTSQVSNEHGTWEPGLDPASTQFNGRNAYEWLLQFQVPASLLPVTLTSFKARAAGSKVELNWSTATETNSSHFTIERSSDGRSFREIGRVNSNGNSSIARNYSFTDNSPFQGNNYYRLKMVDKDATFEYSNIEKVSMNGSNLEFSFSPNPVVNEALLQLRGKYKGPLKLMVTDLMGRTVKSFSYSMNNEQFSQKISLSDLPAGQYFVNIRGDNVNFNQRIIKQ